MDTIVFNSVEYPVKEVYIQKENYGWVKVATTDLSNVLFNNVGEYVSKEAEVIDEQIMFFVESNELELPARELQRIVRECLN